MHARPEPAATCPICSAPSPTGFLYRSSVPVHQNVLYETREAARSVARGELDLRACLVCRFVFNAAFVPELLSYDASYDNSQDASPAFSLHVDSLVRRVTSRPESRRGRIVEVGCGKGAFLRKLLADPVVRGEAVGFDPTYVGPAAELEGRLRFEREFYSHANAIEADVVVCRHLVEHLPDPVALMRAAEARRLFVETPSVEWILRHRVPWDFFYEHCSLFTAASLEVAMERAGYRSTSVDVLFGGQYLWGEGSNDSRRSTAPPAEPFDDLIGGYDAAPGTALAAALVHELAAESPTMVWGAGAKGATFCDLVDPDGSVLAGVIDLNPAKQGCYLVGTGHAILSPQEAVDGGLKTAVVLNPNYAGEVAALLVELGSSATTCDLTATALR